MKTLFVALLITCAQAEAAEWDAVDKALFTTQVVLQVTDTLQTNYIRKHPERFEEANPLYGNPPNMLKVVAVKSLFVGGLYWITRDMNSFDRKFILGVADVIQLSVVNHNYQLGVGVSF